MKILIFFLFLNSCYTTSTQKLKGRIKSNIMAIGGETTGVILITKENNSVELVLKNQHTNQHNEVDVEVEGKYKILKGIERGERKVFIVDKIIYP